MNNKILELLKDAEFVKEFTLAKTNDEAKNLLAKKETKLTNEELLAVTQITNIILKKAKELKKKGISEEMLTKLTKKELSEEELELCVGGGKFFRAVGYLIVMSNIAFAGDFLSKEAGMNKTLGRAAGAAVGYLATKGTYSLLDTWSDSLDERQKKLQKRIKNVI